MPLISGNKAGVIAITMWSFANFIITLTQGIPPFLLGFFVMLIGGIILLLWEIKRGRKLQEIYRQSPFAYAITLLGIGGYVLLHYVAFKIASPFEVNVIDFTWPIYLVLFSAVFYKDKMGLFRIAGIAMGFIGMVILFSGNSLEFNSQEWVGYSCSLVGAILFGLYGALTRKTHFPNGFIGLIFIITGFISLTLHLLFEEMVFPADFVVWLAVFGLAVIRIAYAFWDYAMKRGDAVMLASLSYLLPLFSTLIFVIFGHVPLSYWTGLAGGLIVIGCLTVNFHEIRKFLKRDNDDAL